MSTIQFVELDQKGEPTSIESLEASAFQTIGDGVIVLNEGVPKMNSKEFDAWLAEWHRTHNVSRAGITR